MSNDENKDNQIINRSFEVEDGFSKLETPDRETMRRDYEAISAKAAREEWETFVEYT